MRATCASLALLLTGTAAELQGQNNCLADLEWPAVGRWAEYVRHSIFSNLCDGGTLVGRETVNVPAGSYKALHFHNDKYDSDSWISTVVPFALVKSVTPRHTIELKAVGNGATSSITETPKELPGTRAPSSQ